VEQTAYEVKKLYLFLMHSESCSLWISITFHYQFSENH